MPIVDQRDRIYKNSQRLSEKNNDYLLKIPVHLRDHMVSRTHLIVKSDQVKGGFREVENEARLPFLREALQFWEELTVSQVELLHLTELFRRCILLRFDANPVLYFFLQLLWKEKKEVGSFESRTLTMWRLNKETCSSKRKKRKTNQPKGLSPLIMGLTSEVTQIFIEKKKGEGMKSWTQISVNLTAG